MTRLLSEQERRLQKKTALLMEHLTLTERRAEELQRETDRLRRIKDEAMESVRQKHPYLFTDNLDEDDPNNKDPLSEGSIQTCLEDARISKEWHDICKMLGKPGSSRDHQSITESIQARLDNVRREAGVGSSNHEDNNNAAAQTVAALWPKDCIPVPIETFKRILAETEAAKNVSRANMDPPNLRNDYPETVKSDDTSNDAADISQELSDHVDNAEHEPRVHGHSDGQVHSDTRRKAFEEPINKNVLIHNTDNRGFSEEPQRVIQNVSQDLAEVGPRQEVLGDEEAKNEVNNGQVDVKSVQQSSSDHSSSLARNIQQSRELLNAVKSPPKASGSPTLKSGSYARKDFDEHYVLNSTDRSEKLYSTATDTEEEESLKKVNKKYRPPNIPYGGHATTSSSQTSSSSTSKVQGTQKQPHNEKVKNPLQKYINKAAAPMKLETDSESNKFVEEETVSGPENEVQDDDDFWN